MIEILQSELNGIKSDEEKSNKTREFLQVLILKVLFDKAFFENISFTGGTALRLIYGMRRFSEDLDFSLVFPKGFDFHKLVLSLLSELKRYNLFIEGKSREKGVVRTLMIKFPDLMEKLGVMSYQKSKLAVKVEIDMNPPKGGLTHIVPFTNRFVMAIRTFDLPSLFATKLHACFFRKYTKGRDYYDLVWYLGKKTVPNFTLLNNAILQTEKKDPGINEKNYRKFLVEKLKNIDFLAIRKDVERFLEDKSELKFLDRDIIVEMLEG